MTTQLAKFLDHNAFEPWDVLFRDFFNRDSFFLPAESAKTYYPTDMYEDDNNLNIDIAVAGLDNEDIKIEEEDGVLKVSYNKQEESKDENCWADTGKRYIQKSIARRSFNLGWRISDKKFDLKNINAEIDKGILKITIPKIEELKAVKNTIKIKQKQLNK